MLAEYFRANKVLVQDLFKKMATLKLISYIYTDLTIVSLSSRSPLYHINKIVN